MKVNKAVYVTKNKIRDDRNIVYQLYRSENDTPEKYEKNFSCQYDSKRNNEICTCKNVITLRKRQEMRYFSDIPKQIYACHGSRSYTDVGVGSVKVLERRKVKRVYLPETDNRAVGSSDLSSFIFRRRRSPKIITKNSYYDHKKTSSKCIGGILEYNTGCVIHEKLSPIVQTKSGTTSPNRSFKRNNNEIGSNTVDKKLETIGTQFEKPSTEDIEEKEVEPEPKADTSAESKATKKIAEKTHKPKPSKKVSEQTQKSKYSNECLEEKKKPELDKRIREVETTYSSDSLVQHVHNLENPSDEKHSRTSFPDPMENKLEREYRKMFSTKSKDIKSSFENAIPEFKSASILRRRFEALRRGLKKDDSSAKAKTSVTMKTSARDLPMHKDASVTSDPPSLIGRSYSNTKKYSPAVQNVEQEKQKYPPCNNEGYNSRVSNNATESECQGVKGMFKLWGKKFNFEEEQKDIYDRSQTLPTPPCDIEKKSEKEVNKKPSSKIEPASKKEGRKFFFFKKKSRDKNKESYKPKSKAKDVTAGRCEIRDGLSIKLGGSSSAKERVSKISEEGDDITRRTWLKKFMTNTIESARSVNVRWNNSMYATSSSTVFELLDNVYKSTGVVLRSQSEITTEESSFYRYTKNKVNFVQDIEAWMIPKTIPDKLTQQIPLKIISNNGIKEKTIEVKVSDQKWFIDKSDAFAHTVELVLHSDNGNKSADDKVSSEYLRIDIPINFFDSTSSEESKRNHSVSDEEVYKIVEYVTDSEIGRGRKVIKDLEKGDHVSNEIQIKVSLQDSTNFESQIFETVIKKPPTHRDVVIQGSNVNIPKRCDVIGVGIITQRDLRVIRKPILKIQDDLSDDESELVMLPHKKCEFAESYLHEYYRHCPLGIDPYSTCVSDSYLKSCSEKSVLSYKYQGDCSKSCPNIYDDFQTATMVSSLDNSSCSQGFYENQFGKNECDSFSHKLFKKFKKKPEKAKTDTDVTEKRILPKDSLEVFKRRKMYAASNKSQWIKFEDYEKPVSIPSSESKGAQNTMLVKYSKDSIRNTIKKSCKKHVSMPDCETITILEGKPSNEHVEVLSHKEIWCEACKRKGSKCSKHIIVQSTLSCETPQSPCKAACETLEGPHCNKPFSPSCTISMRSTSPKGTSHGQSPPKCRPCFPSTREFAPQSGDTSPIAGGSPLSPSQQTSQKSGALCDNPTSQSNTTKESDLPSSYFKSSPERSPSPSPSSSPTLREKPSCEIPSQAPSTESNIPQTESNSSCPQACIKQSLPNSRSKLPRKKLATRDSPPPPQCKKISPLSPHCKKQSTPPKTPPPSKSDELTPHKSPFQCFPPPPSKSPPREQRSTSSSKLPRQSPPQTPPQETQQSPIEPNRKKYLKPCESSPLDKKLSSHQKSPTPPCKKATDPRLPMPQEKSTLTYEIPPPSHHRTPVTCGKSPIKKRCGRHEQNIDKPHKEAKGDNCGKDLCISPPRPKLAPCRTNPSGCCHSASSCHVSASGLRLNLLGPKTIHDDPCPKSSLTNKPNPLNSSALDKKIFNVCESSCNSKSSSTSSQSLPPLPEPRLKTSSSPCQTDSPNNEPESKCPGLLLKARPVPPVPIRPPKKNPLKSPKPPKLKLCKTPPCNQITQTKHKVLPKEKACKEQKASEGCPDPMSNRTKCTVTSDERIFKQKASKESIHPCPMINQKSSSLNKGNSSKCPPEVPKASRQQCESGCSMNEMVHSKVQTNTNIEEEKQQGNYCNINLMPQLSSANFFCPAGICVPESNNPQPCLERFSPLKTPGTPKPTKKMSGIFLKMKPSKKKTCAEECSAWNQNEVEQGMVQLNSNERLYIKIKQQTPSTEEIRKIRRDPVNIKMIDEDGQTLYERKDYTCEEHRPSVLGDMYRDSKINRVSTLPDMAREEDENREDLAAYKSDQSISNLIEIQVKLRINQGDKTTEINIGSDKEKIQEPRTVNNKIASDVFIARNTTEKLTEEVPRSDINIRIIVRNFKPKHNNLEEKQCVDEFTKKISDKFHTTVSTGYSDVTDDPKSEQVFSIHRATVDLSSSEDKSKTHSKISNDVPSKDFTENDQNLTVSSHSAEQLPVDVTEDENLEETSLSIKKDSVSEKLDETNTNESELPDFNDIDYQDTALLDQNMSNEKIDIVKSQNSKIATMSKHTSRDVKKALLKKVFKRTGKTEKNKESVRQLRDMLKIILTDSSDNGMATNSNELLNDVTYASLKPNYFRDTDSMNNYYQLDSTLSSLRDSKVKALYPSEESRASGSSESYTDDVTFHGCMCSKVAERLSQCKMNITCCCRQKKKDEETICDLRNDEDLFLFNYKRAEYVDVETQNSKYLASQVNSLDVSIHSKNKSIIKTKEDIKVVETLEIKQSSKEIRRDTNIISPYKSHIRELEVKILNQNTVTKISDNDKVLNVKPTKQFKEPHHKKGIKKRKHNDFNLDDIEVADVLQSYEAKKAVLEIYAEKTEDGKHLVAKLPKFTYDKENEITKHYEQLTNQSYRSVCIVNKIFL